VVSFFLKRALKKVAKNLNKNFTEQQTAYNNPTNTKKQTPSSKGIQDKGEYVDFEEIKE
jgi:hypothetical protein